MHERFLTVSQGADYLKAGKVIAYPTEAVYGLGCDPSNRAAVHSILSLKSRKPEAGLILIADRFERFLKYIKPIKDDSLQRAMNTWPGPVTWLFPRASRVPDWLAGKHQTIAVRVSAHPVCRSLCELYGGAVVSTSANPRSAAPARTVAMLIDYFADGIAGIVEGELGSESSPSEIRDLATGEVIRAV